MKDEVFEIYLSDLKVEAQTRLLRFLGLREPSQGNLDVFPISQLPRVASNET